MTKTLDMITREWFQRIWVAHEIDAVDELHAAVFVDYSPSGRESHNEAYKAGIAELYEAFPDWTATIEDLICDPMAGKVAIRWVGTGTHRGAFLGCEPTNRLVQFVGIDIIQVVEGRIVARWGEWDGLALLEQLGGYHE